MDPDTDSRSAVGVLHDKSQSTDHLFLLPLIFGAYLLAKPFYVFPSGLPQPADILIVILLMFVFFARPVEWTSEAAAACVCAVCFTAYAVLISLTHAFMERDLGIAANAMYYAFNTALLTTCMYLSQKYKDSMLRTMFYAGAISVYIQTVAAVVLGGSVLSGRSIGFFNNPNQLCYWSLLSASLILMLSRQLRTGALVPTTVFFACLYMSLLSLSKAALVSMFVLGILHAMKRASYLIMTLLMLLLGWQIVVHVSIAEYWPAYGRAVERLQGSAPSRMITHKAEGTIASWTTTSIFCLARRRTA